MHHNESKYMKAFTLVIICTALSFIVGCNSLVPDKYKQKQLSAEIMDANAGKVLSTNVTDSLGRIIPGASHHISSRTLASLVDSVLQDTLTQFALISDQVTAENHVIPKVFSSISDSLAAQGMIRDSLMTVMYPTGQKISYALFTVSATDGKDIYIYEALQFNQDTTSQHTYNQNNHNEYVAIELLRNDASTVASTQDMAQEVVSASSQVIPLPGTDEVLPTIRARYKLHVDPGTYLVRFTVSSPATMRLFKVLILSI